MIKEKKCSTNLKKFANPNFKKINMKKMILTKRCLLLFVILISSANLYAAAIFQWKKIDVNVQNVSLVSVLQHIEKETGCNIAYINSVVDKYKGVTVKLSNSTVQEILNDVLKNTNLKYSIENNTITIVQKNSFRSTTSKATKNICKR